MAEVSDPPVHPVQTKRGGGHPPAQAPQVVTLRAYEVYVHVHNPQPAMVTGGCRGGFSASELIALLYAHSFEALTGMRGI